MLFIFISMTKRKTKNLSNHLQMKDKKHKDQDEPFHFLMLGVCMPDKSRNRIRLSADLWQYTEGNASRTMGNSNT